MCGIYFSVSVSLVACLSPINQPPNMALERDAPPMMPAPRPSALRWASSMLRPRPFLKRDTAASARCRRAHWLIKFMQPFAGDAQPRGAGHSATWRKYSVWLSKPVNHVLLIHKSSMPNKLIERTGEMPAHSDPSPRAGRSWPALGVTPAARSSASHSAHWSSSSSSARRAPSFWSGLLSPSA